ncbi:hypothetical protein BAUCODRAFT_301911 [Baudoinia panamericana UAMH 10762]|uniref:Uncharacterized protein n=1 Tax=Baudoinia panamericana (strain UAMH 10762) TaxID=717646 RepID=M2M519_BAUPA|nr:uncharacterized protein BAUCODRAFT_301911 [Baudoinia panamericana UAMH 10762]EMC91711.1 hypothetical protein BAUCODRAFT_301911 [Baudoinia panamericana UAMH 10762]
MEDHASPTRLSLHDTEQPYHGDSTWQMTACPSQTLLSLRENSNTASSLVDSDVSQNSFANATPSEAADYYEQHTTATKRPRMNDDFEEARSSFMDQAFAEGLLHECVFPHPFQSPYMPSPPSTTLGDLEDPAGAPSAGYAAALDLVTDGEKWEVDKASAGFLASLMALGKPCNADVRCRDEDVGFCDLRVEEPLLRCDPALELQAIRRRHLVTIAKRDEKPIRLDMENDESLEWPTRLKNLPAQFYAHAVSEKLEVGTDVLRYLREVARPTMLSEEELMGESMQSLEASLGMHLSVSVC